MPLGPDLIQDGLILDLPVVGAAIETLFAERDAPKKGVIASLTGLGSISRILSLPKMAPHLLEGAIRREAKREMSMPIDELYLYHHVIDEKGNQQRVYVLGVPRELVDAHVKAFQAAEIKLKAVDLKPLALVRAVNRRNGIIADLEEDSFHVIVVVDAIPVIIRSVALSGEGGGGYKAHRLVQEATRTVDFYNNGHPDSPLQPSAPVFLTGELAAVPSVNKTIQNEMKHPIEVPQPPLTYPDALPLPRFMVNIGLALKRGA